MNVHLKAFLYTVGFVTGIGSVIGLVCLLVWTMIEYPKVAAAYMLAMISLALYLEVLKAVKKGDLK